MVFTIPLFKKTQEKNDVLVRLTRENLLGVRVLRAFNKQEKEISTPASITCVFFEIPINFF